MQLNDWLITADLNRESVFSLVIRNRYVAAMTTEEML